MVKLDPTDCPDLQDCLENRDWTACLEFQGLKDLPVGTRWSPETSSGVTLALLD